MAAPFRVEVYDKDLKWKCLLGDIVNMRAVVRLNNRGNCELNLRSANNRIPLMQTAGTRLRVLFRGEPLISGPIDEFWGEGPSLTGLVTFNLIDDFEYIGNFLAWPNPAGAITEQNREAYTRTGPAETVFKDFVTANIMRRALQALNVKPNLGRGAPISVSGKFQYLNDVLLPQVTDAGLRIQVIHNKATGQLDIDAFPVADYPNKLTQQSRAIKKWRYKHTRTVVTNLVLGGHGEQDNRDFRLYSKPDRRALLHQVMEMYVDAHDTGTDYDQHLRDRENQQKTVDREYQDWQEAEQERLVSENRLAQAGLIKRSVDAGSDSSLKSDANSENSSATSAYASDLAETTNRWNVLQSEIAELARLDGLTAGLKAEYEAMAAERAEQAFSDGAEQGTMIIELAEAGTFRALGPKGLQLGQKVRCDVGGGTTLTDVVREMSIDWDSDNGLTVECTVGYQDDPQQAVLQAVAALARSIHNEKVSK